MTSNQGDRWDRELACRSILRILRAFPWTMKSHGMPGGLSLSRRNPLKPISYFFVNFLGWSVFFVPLMGVSPLSAIDIIPIFNVGANTAPINLQDPAGANLIGLFNYAAGYYEDIFEDADHTLTINFWWEDLDPISPNRIGQHDLIQQSNVNFCTGISAPSPLCRETVANIRIDNDQMWFLDPTPANDSEFAMQQTLWRDLSGAQQSDLFNDFGTSVIPPTFEVGFGGPAVDAAAMSRFDALSVIFHEIGHALGMSFLNNSTIAETGDLDYSFNPDFIVGQSLAAEVADGANIGHLDASGFALMMPSLGGAGNRALPSHTDLFSMAAGHSYVDLDVPRREMYGGNAWHVDGSWSGNQIPGAADLAFVRHGGFVSLVSDDAFVGGLTVDEGSQFATATNRLTVFDTLTVQNTPGTGLTLLSVSTGGEVVADAIIIESNSRMFVGGDVDANNIEIAAGGEITGNDGSVNVTNAIGNFINNGRIAAVFGGTLTIDSDNLLDLDGTTGDGVLEAIDGNLILNASPTDVFNGTATAGAGHTMSFNGGIAVGAGGLLFVDGQTGNSAFIHGIVTINNAGVLRGDGRAIVSSALTLNAGGIVETEDAATELHLNGFTNLAGAGVVGPGTVFQTGDAVVTADTTISVGTYDMDGLNVGNTIDVQAGRTLRIESASVESIVGDGFDGTLNINSGTVEIVAPWVLEGSLDFNDTGTGSPVLAGAGGVTVEGGMINFNGGTGLVDTPISVNNGTVLVDAVATMNGPTTLGANASVDIDADGDALWLRGQTTLVAPTIVGNGRLILEDTVNVSFANTTIAVAETDLDGVTGDTEITIHNGLTLSVVSTTIEPAANDGFDGTIHNHGTFSVLAGWRLDGTLNMDPTAANTATLSGAGPFEVFSSGIVNAREEVAINPTTTVAGTINVTAGRTQMNGGATFLTTANVNITSTGELELNGATTFRGGSYQGAGTFQWDGPVTVAANTSLNIGIVDMDGTSGNTVTTLSQSRLTLHSSQVDTTNNRYDGTLNVNGRDAGLTLNLNTPNASWQMDGILNANGSIGSPRQQTLQGSPVLVSGTINAGGNVEVSAPLDISGTILLNNINSELWLSQNTHIIRNTANISGPGQIVIAANGIVLADNGSTINAEVYSLGRFEPGTSTGTARITDDYTQLASAVLGIEIAGAPGTNQDLLQVTGIANLDGELEVTVIEGAIPSIGPVYTLLSAASVTGTFDTLTLQSETIFEYQATLSHGNTRVTLQFTDISMFGDFNDDLTLNCTDVDALVAEIAGGGMGMPFDLNGDTIVNMADLNLWLQEAGTFNVGGPYLPGDATLDGLVDGSDFGIWNANKFTFDNGWCGGDFNADGSSDGSDFGIWNANKFQSSSAATQVPEPTAHLIILSILATLGMSRQRSEDCGLNGNSLIALSEKPGF
jgi:hypothetical protein